jgi:hypothetical protein
MLPPTPALRRAFTTTTRRLVGPESPSFIEIPAVKLPKTHPRTRAKGVLPVPRNLFPETRPDKASPEYLAAATKEPSAPRHKSTEPESAAYQEWAARMAEKRRSNLREGLTELKERKERLEGRRKQVLEKRNTERDAALMKAEAEDVRLTLPSVLSTMRIQPKGVVPDPRREERLEEMRARREEMEQEKFEERQRAVHDLYLNASKFILTEAQLDKAIEEQFKESMRTHLDLPLMLPPTIREMMVRKEKGNTGMTTTGEELSVLEIGGELTGGKLGNFRQ